MRDRVDAPIRVVIPTFQRNVLLENLLQRIDAHVAGLAATPDSVDIARRTEIQVIDNDPQAAARIVVDAATIAVPVAYAHEPRPGIGAVRARALSEAAAGSVIVFIDDDEVPGPRWLEPLVRYWERTGAEVIVGHVVTEFVEPPPAWVLAGEFFDRPPKPTGTSVCEAATSNMLLDVDGIAAHGLTFDASRGLQGGEDSLFTRHLSKVGGRILWCAESQVVDPIPPQRATRRWVLTRKFSHATVSVSIGLALADSWSGRVRVRLASMAKGVALVLRGIGRGLLGVVTRNQRHKAWGGRYIARGLGLAGGALGHKQEEYRRA